MLGWFQRLRVIVSLMLVAATQPGCGDEQGNCSAICMRMVAFRLAQPLSGRDFRISVGPPKSGIGCSVDGATEEATCTSSSDVDAFFQGARLESVTWSEPVIGQVEISIDVDGIVQVDRQFAYTPAVVGELCGQTCYEDVEFVIE